MIWVLILFSMIAFVAAWYWAKGKEVRDMKREDAKRADIEKAMNK